MMDARKKKVLSVLGIACLILAWRGYVVATKYLPSPAEASTAESATEPALQQQIPPADQQREDQSEKLLTRQQEIAAQPWGRDPFKEVPGAKRLPPDEEQVIAAAPSEEPPPSPPSLRLTGVSRSGDQWLAVAQGRIVRIGDVVEDQFTVVEITKGSMTLRSGRWLFHYQIGADGAAVGQMPENP